MSEFTASNGTKFEVFSDGMLATFLPNGYDGYQKVRLTDGAVEALREFFQAEQDERLGRWRWPENPGYVVYPVGEGVVDVLREASVSRESRGPGRVAGITRHEAARWDAAASRHFYTAARAYFDAHPEPKPWSDAKPGELWMLTIDGEEQEAFAHQMPHHQTVMFQTKHRSVFGVEGSAITAGRRVWPEDAS